MVSKVSLGNAGKTCCSVVYGRRPIDPAVPLLASLALVWIGLRPVRNARSSSHI